MNEDLKTYRIRTKVGEEKPTLLNVQLNQTYDMFEILSLKINQNNAYKYYSSDYGVIVGRVLANGGVGIPNAKVSIFIPTEESVNDIKNIFYIDIVLYNRLMMTASDIIYYQMKSMKSVIRILVLSLTKGLFLITRMLWRFSINIGSIRR